MKIVIDPGHGGSDPGALAHDGTRESDINLEFAKILASMSEDYGIEVVPTRVADEFVSLEDRAKMANEAGPDCIISVHANAAASDNASGFEVWTSPGNTPADQLATWIYDNLEMEAPISGRPDYDDGDPDREARFYILRRTTAPAVLVEFGFMTNQTDLGYLKDPAWRSRMARAVFYGMVDWLEEKG